MTNEYKANLWNECLQQNIFSNCRQEELPRVQELFEQTIEENKDVNTNDFISILGVKLNQMSYKDLIPSEKQPMIDFSDNIEEEPLKDIDKLIAEKQKERQNDEPIKMVSSQPVLSQPVLSHPVLSQSVLSQPVLSHPVLSQPVLSQPVPSQSVPSQSVPSKPIQPNPEIIELKQMIQQQNIILEKLLESQIKILRQLQKK